MSEKTATIKLAPKVSNIPDLMGYEISKIATQKIAGQYLGDSTLQSGILKFIAGMGIEKAVPNQNGTLGEVKKYTVAGLVMDGTEDMTLGLLNLIGSNGINIPFLTPRQDQAQMQII